MMMMMLHQKSETSDITYQVEDSMFGAFLMGQNGHQYEEIPNGNNATANGNGSSNSNSSSGHNAFWDARSFFRTWSLMKVFMLGMVVLLIGIIVVQGVEEHNVVVEHELFEQEAHEALQQDQQTIHRMRHHHTNTNNDNDNDNSNDNSNDNNNGVPSLEHPIATQSQSQIQQSQPSKTTNTNSIAIPMPSGVNIGSWLSLEDYFFAGLHNSVEVATPGIGTDTTTQVAACLPPLHVGSTTGPKWQSETDLFRNLMMKTKNKNTTNKNGSSSGGVKHAIQVFAAHRASYVDLETDLQRIAELGITTVRIPMGWCWTDVDPRKVDLDSYESDADLLRDFACVDPFFGTNDPTNDNDNDNTNNDTDREDDEPQILWPAIPKPLVEDLLRACARAGLNASLDVHTLPGGTSIGTFSGVWPHWPRFWTHGGDGVGMEGVEYTTNGGFNIGHELFAELVAWMEDLSDRDPLAFSGLRGLSPMNEPAHLAGNFQQGDAHNFLPALPRHIADEYLETLNSNSKIASSPIAPLLPDNYSFPDGSHLRVFYWFQGAIEIFRMSKLPLLGIEFQANIIESIFQDQVVASNDDDDDNASEDDDVSKGLEERLRGVAIATWWCSNNAENDATTTTTTSAEERSDWAVLDLHHYHAWSDDCSGTIDGQDSGYACGDIVKRSETLDACTTWVQNYRDIVDAVCGTTSSAGTATTTATPSKLMSAEFSAASHHSVRRSCSDTSGLKESYTKQVAAAEVANVDLFYWSYKMPYGGSFKQAGWSFSELLYKFGVPNSRPDSTQFECDAHLFDDPDVPT